MDLGAWLRSGEGIGLLPAGTIPNPLYRVPFFYLFLPCVFCCSFIFVVFVLFSVVFFCSRWSLVDAPLIFFCPADHVPDWQDRIYLLTDSVDRSYFGSKRPYYEMRCHHLTFTPPSHFQHLHTVVVVVAFTLTDRASTIPSNIRGCQSGTWSQRGTKVNGSHHGDNPLLRPTGIQIATKSYATLQAMAPTNSKTVHQTSFTPYREQPRSTRIVVAYPRPAFSATNRTNTFQPVSINNSKFLKATHRTKIRKIEIPRSMVVEALSC